MSFNAAVPLNSDSPAIFPAQNQTNMARLQTIISSDHQFNLTAASDDGYHNIIRMTQQLPSGPVVGFGRSYAKTSNGVIHQFYMDNTGADYQITPTIPIRAAVNFNGNVAAPTMRSQVNVTSVVRPAGFPVGTYRVNFTTAMPNANYFVHVTGMRPTTGSYPTPCVRGDTVYSNSMSANFVIVSFFNNAGNLQDVLMGSVTIFSAT